MNAGQLSEIPDDCYAVCMLIIKKANYIIIIYINK